MRKAVAGAWVVVGLVAGAGGKEVLPEPTYENTFYLFMGDGYRGSLPGETPYAPGWPTGALPYHLQVAKLREMVQRLGPDGPYLRLGVADCLWPTEVVDPANGWAYVGEAGLGAQGELPPGEGLVPKGPDPYFNMVIVRSWAEVGVPAFLVMNGGNLARQIWWEVNDTAAVPANLTAYLEQWPQMVQRYDDNRISPGDNLNGVHEPRDYVEGGEWNGNVEHGTMLGFSRLLPDSLAFLWKRNMRAAMSHVLRINERYPGLVVAVSIEPENDMNFMRCYQGDCARFADFSPLALEEWRQWLSHTGIYGPGGAFYGQGADPWYPTVWQLNAATGSTFTSWDEVDPRSPKAGPALWAMYLDGGDGDGEFSSAVPEGSGHVQGWCERMVEHRCEDSIDLLWSVAQDAGWSRSQLFTHQVPGGFVDDALDPQDVPYWGYGHRLCTLAACAVANGRPGITGFRLTTVNTRLFRALRQLSCDGSWANLEFNPIKASYCPGFSDDYTLWSTAYRLNWEEGAHLLCAFRWWVPPEASTWWANIRPDFHRPPQAGGDPEIDFQARLDATRDFVSDPSIRFRPWSPQASLTDPLDFIPPAPGLGDIRVDLRHRTVSFEIQRRIFASCAKLLWYDDRVHPEWPESVNVYGWPEFSRGRFHVYRDTLPSFEPSPANLLTVVTVPSFSVRDTLPPGAGSVFYAVVAEDNGGDRSAPSRIWAAPQVTCTPQVVLVVQGSEVDTSLQLGNEGLMPLVVHGVSSSQPWLLVQGWPQTVAPGAEASVRLTVLAGLEPGEHVAQVSIATNDPFTPEARAEVVAIVEPQGAETAPGTSLWVVPQPAGAEATVEWRGIPPGEAVQVELVDLTGRAVWVGQRRAGPDGLRARLDTSSLAPGHYVLRVQAGAKAAQGRLVVVH